MNEAIPVPSSVRSGAFQGGLKRLLAGGQGRNRPRRTLGAVRGACGAPHHVSAQAVTASSGATLSGWIRAPRKR